MPMSSTWSKYILAKSNNKINLASLENLDKITRIFGAKHIYYIHKKIYRVRILGLYGQSVNMLLRHFQTYIAQQSTTKKQFFYNFLRVSVQNF